MKATFLKSKKTGQVVKELSRTAAVVTVETFEKETKEMTVSTVNRWWEVTEEGWMEADEVAPDENKPVTPKAEKEVPLTAEQALAAKKEKEEKIAAKKAEKEAAKKEKADKAAQRKADKEAGKLEEKPSVKVEVEKLVAGREDVSVKSTELGEMLVKGDLRLAQLSPSAFRTTLDIAKALGLSYEEKKYNHAYRAKVLIPEGETLASVLEKLATYVAPVVEEKPAKEPKVAKEPKAPKKEKEEKAAAK